MGVTYKLKDEVVHFIISQRQGNPLSSCRQLAESASQKFGLNLSKSSVHDVLKESGIITPRGRKPKDKFEIPQEKKKQIQSSLSQIKLIAPPVVDEQVKLLPDPAALQEHLPSVIASPEGEVIPGRTTNFVEIALSSPTPRNDKTEVSAEYEGAGKIFLKAALWDLGIFSEDNIKQSDWDYYLTYSKGIKVFLENNTDFFIDLPLPIERCIREVADGLISNVRPLIVDHVSDESLFKTAMEAGGGFNIKKISIVDQKDHNIFIFENIVEFKRIFNRNNRIFVESNHKNIAERTKALFFSQAFDVNDVIDNISNLRGSDHANNEEITISLLVDDSYNNKNALQEAADKLNGMFLRDEQDRLVKVKISAVEG